MKINRSIILVTAMGLLTAVSCKKTSPYETKDVSIEINIVQSSAGFAEVIFTPSKNAFYYFGIVELDSGATSPTTDAEHFMRMQLDSAQIEYMQWRHGLLNDNVPYIASFADHSLSYGKSDAFFLHLLPERSYFIYAFVVDPESVTPVSGLFSKCIKTKLVSEIDMSFDYRINGTWDYIYPVNSKGQIVSDHPYMAFTVPKDSIVACFEGDTTGINTPYYFFAFNFVVMENMIYRNDDLLYLGIYSKNHDGSDNRITQFVPGVTYYTGIVSADGIVRDDQICVYKFEYEEGMNRRFEHRTDTLGSMKW